MIILKNADQLAKMRSAGHLLHDVLAATREEIRPGMTTMDVNAFVEHAIRKGGGIPTELGYMGYPASICASIDDEVVHGIPSTHVVLKEGQILSVDVTLALDGWQADSAFTIGIGKISTEKQRLIEITEECFWQGYRKALNGNRIGDIACAVQTYAESHGCGVVRALTGHGIGREMHEDPSVPNFGEAGHGPRLRPGETFCIEPMINAGTWKVHDLADGWTVVTNDHAPSAHYEHTVAVRKEGYPEILTLPDWEKRCLAL